MPRFTLQHVSFSVALLSVAGCDSAITVAPIPYLEASTVDSGVFVVPDAGVDSGVDAGHDAGIDAAPPVVDAQPDTTVHDAGLDSSVDSGSDAGHEASVVDAPHEATPPADTGTDAKAATDAGSVPCASVGGTCVALTPTSCAAPSTVGNAALYSCGPGIGDECCIPPSTAAPTCKTVNGTLGWYSTAGALICAEACTGATAACTHVGTSSQGWYSTNHGCAPHADEIQNDPSCS